MSLRNGTISRDCILSCTFFTTEEAANLEHANFVTSLISFLGSLFIMLVYTQHRAVKELRTFAFRLVFFTAVADFFLSIGGMLGDAGGSETTYFGATPGLCLFQAWLISYFQLASLIWSVSIAFTLHQGFLKRNPDFGPKEVEKHAKWYHLIAWGWPLIMSLLPFATDSYGDEGGYCWIQSHPDHVPWRFAQFYIPLSIAIIYNGYVYFNVWRTFKQHESANDDKARRQMVARLKFYPLVLVICHLVGLVVTIDEAATSVDREDFALTMVYLIFSSLQGFFDAVVYGLTPDIQNKILPACLQKNNVDIEAQKINNDE